MAIEGNQVIVTGTQVPINGSHIGKVYETRTSAMLRNIKNHSEYFECPKLAKAGLNAIINAPLVVGETCYGCLAVANENADAFTAQDMVTLTSLARCLASYLLLHDQLEQLAELVLKDPLTRLHNRRYFEECMDSCWDAWANRGQRFSLVMLDIDHFKEVNDSYGHPFGDFVLREVAGILRASARAQDVVARMGGEEFSLILTDISQEQALSIAERLRRRVEAHDFTLNDERIGVTISLGVASTREDHVSHDALTLDADTSLYAAKGSGRNRVKPNAAA